MDERCDRFEKAWQAGERPCIEDFLADTPEPERSLLLRELLGLELAYRRDQGEALLPEEYHQRFPDDVGIIHAVFRGQASEARDEAESSSEPVSTGPEVAGAGDADSPARLSSRCTSVCRSASGSIGESAGMEGQS